MKKSRWLISVWLKLGCKMQNICNHCIIVEPGQERAAEGERFESSLGMRGLLESEIGPDELMLQTPKFSRIDSALSRQTFGSKWIIILCD